jgi:predicted enzyme related to lactoylglutathione lyase
MAHAVVHFEIGAADDGSLVTFYGGVFGWTLRGSATGGHTMIDTRGPGISGGIGKSATGEAWTSFCVETDDPQATLDKANSLGGTIAMPVTDVDGDLTMAMFHDLDGLPVGLVRAPVGTAPRTPGASAGSVEPVDWFEVMGSDAARTQQFYRDLFGWTIDPGFPGYGVVDTGGGRGIQGGIGGGVESRWTMVYAGVADVDQTLRRAEDLGGSRIPAPAVVALKNAARIALYGSADDVSTGVFRDPAGNLFGVYHKEAVYHTEAA